MTTNLCSFLASVQHGDQRTSSSSSDDILNYESGNMDIYLKDEFNTELLRLSKGRDTSEDGSQQLELMKKSSSWCSLGLASLWNRSKPSKTRSCSDLEGLVRSQKIEEEPFEFFNVSIPDLISGHVCHDICSCFCNIKLKQANKFRNVIIYNYQRNQNCSAIHSDSVLLSQPPSSLMFKRDCDTMLSKYPTQAVCEPRSARNVYHFTDDQAIIRTFRRTGDNLLRHSSCPVELHEISTSLRKMTTRDLKVANVVSPNDTVLRYDDMLALKRIQNEIFVIQLKHDIVLKDYYRRKWAKLEEKKILQISGRIENVVQTEMLNELDTELLELSKKFREETCTIKRLLNVEHDKISRLHSRNEDLLRITNYKIDSKAHRGKECSKYKESDVFMDSDVCIRSPSQCELESTYIDDICCHDSSSNQSGNITSDISSPSEMFATSVNFRDSCQHKVNNRPLTRYLPIKGDEATFDLRIFIEQAGHSLDLCSEIKVTSHDARGFLKKIGKRIKTWRRRWFVFDRSKRQLSYYSDRSELMLKGRIPFQTIEDVYIDGAVLQCASTKATFYLKTLHGGYILAAPSNRARQIWMNALFTGAEAYQNYIL